jgi:hypothetical protein
MSKPNTCGWCREAVADGAITCDPVCARLLRVYTAAQAEPVALRRERYEVPRSVEYHGDYYAG